MRLFISKYELKKLILEEHQFHDNDLTIIYNRQHFCHINKISVPKCNIFFFKINAIFHFKLFF
jgi:hypothetical protein